MHNQATRLQRATRILFGVWLVGTLVVGGYLMAGHLIPMPASSPHPGRNTALAGLRVRGDQPWVAAHILLSTCGCSGRIVQHLLARGPLPDLEEHVLLIDGDDPEGARAMALPLGQRGFLVQVITAAAAAERFNLDAAPMLIALSPQNRVAYAGGYTQRKQAAVIHDVDILRRAAGEEPVALLPLFGCAVSEALRNFMDPLGLKKLIGG